MKHKVEICFSGRPYFIVIHIVFDSRESEHPDRNLEEKVRIVAVGIFPSLLPRSEQQLRYVEQAYIHVLACCRRLRTGLETGVKYRS